MEDRVLAKLQIKDKRYEIWVDCDKAMQLRDGRSSDVKSALLVGRIFKDARKGEVAGNLEKEFKTDDVSAIAARIIKEGEVQVSSAYRAKQTETLKNRVIDAMASMAIDSTTNLPIPRKRIELALVGVHHNFDANKPEREHVNELLAELKKTLPIKMGEFNYTAEVPVEFGNETLLYIKRLGEIKSNNRTDTGLEISFSVKAGNENELLSKLRSVTHGKINIRRND